MKPLTLRDLITFEIIEQWYLCQANFLLPTLVLLANPGFFMVIVLFYTFLGVVIAYKKKELRKNNVLLALYPFLFHLCFMIFYWCETVEVIVVTELVCLCVYLVGLFHHVLTLIYDFGCFLAKLWKSCKKGNKITDKQVN